MDVVIIGSGAAGLTAAIYAARADLRTAVIQGEQPGGQLTITSEVENFPGFDEPILGHKLMDTMCKQAEKFGAELITSNVVEVDFKRQPFTLTLSNNATIKTKSVIIATGATAKWLGIPGEDRLKGKGVSACATCDGYFFRNRNVVVVGGGDTALEEAIFLTRYAKQVIVIHRRSEFRASAALVKRALPHPKIKFIWDAIVTEAHGEEELQSITLQDVNTKVERLFEDVQGMFVAIGHTPNSSLFKEQGLEVDANGYILHAPGSTKTNIPGVFVAGDVSDSIYRQAITAAGSGCMSAIDAQKFIAQ